MNVVLMERVTKRYHDVTALDEVSFALAEHAIHGLLGRNGAGKTTAMQILTAQAFATSGTVEVFGRHPYENRDVLRQVCFVKESQRYPDVYQVGHALGAAALAFPKWNAPLAAELVADFALPLNRKIKKLSRGMLSAVGVIIGLASRAPLTFFDEPYLGLDPVARQMFYDRLLADHTEHPRTVVLSTHLIDEVSALIQHVVLIDGGRVLADAPADVLRHSAVAVSGPAVAVESAVAGRRELHREQRGDALRVTVVGQPERPLGDELLFEPLSLQQLVVRMTQSNGSRDVAPGPYARSAR
jgi:ABC-2 type transport system ATP-binding protein